MVINPQANYNSRSNNTSNYIKFKLDLMTYDNLCRYVLQSGKMVRMEHLINLRNLIYLIDPSTYENDPDIVRRINFIVKALEARLDNNLNDMNVILQYINGGLTFKVDFLDYDNLYLSQSEISFIHNLVTETLQFSFMYKRIDQMQDIITRFKTSDYSTRGNIVREFESVIDSTKNDFRRVKTTDNSTDMLFSLRDENFIPAITNTYNLITSPSRRLITGMQGLNEMLAGGFESGRVYMLLGTSGVGKSITLLNIIYQIKKYNSRYDTKDPTKKPCIVLLTMENTVVETITRLFDLVIEGSRGMANYSLDEVINKLRTEGELFVNDSSPIDIVIRFKPNRSINTSYLYSLDDKLSDMGYEMICLVQDHVKRIRSTDNIQDLRIELGEIVNEFKTFAAEKEIPVITDSHLNREATKMIEDAARRGGQDLGKLLGASNIGESMLMIDNLDCGICLTKDYDKDLNLYMCFNRIKMRDFQGNSSQRNYICQPFAPGSTIRLIEDLGALPQFKESLHSAPELKTNTSIKISGASTITGGLDSVIDKKDSDDELNTFAKRTTYNLVQYDEDEIVQPIKFYEDNTKSIMQMISQINQQLVVSEKNEMVKHPISFISNNTT